MRRWLATTFFAALAIAAPASAQAASWARPTDMGKVEGRDLTQVDARGPIKDRILAAARAMASSHQPTRVEQYTDSHGHTIAVGTSIPDISLEPYAQILAGTIHRDELSELAVLVVEPHEVGPECGGGDEVQACYGAVDPDRSYAGLMVVSSADPDLVHSVVHEYGHHTDLALINLAHLGYCEQDNDGSRRWFFARDAYDKLITRSGCNRRTPYRRLLGETFAEDFVVLNGIDSWFLSAFPPPTPGMLNALEADIYSPFWPQYERRYGWLRGRGAYRSLRFYVDVWTLVSARLRGPRRADFDIYLYRRGRQRSLERSRRLRSREQVARWVPPGRYKLVVYSFRGHGSFSVRFDYD